MIRWSELNATSYALPQSEISIEMIAQSDIASDDQVASQDEYEISLSEGIDDDAILDENSARKFSITSYGADYTVDSLVKRMKAKAFRVPDFQRRFVWSQKHASKFIESLLMGLPVPGIFLYKENDTNEHLVIDGQQRLRTLQAFYEGVFNERKFRLIGVRQPWEGCAYEHLEIADQLKLDDSIVHATIFRQDKPADVLDSIYFVFERINSGGIRLSPQEIRNAIAGGRFTAMVKELNKDKSWRKIFGGPENKRSKDDELIIRFFALLESSDNYARPMAKFLNDFTANANKLSPEKLTAYADLFKQTVSLVDEALNGRAFRPARTLNAAVYDSVMVAVASCIRSDPLFDSQELEAAYNRLLENPEYRRAWERATADEESVKSRLRIAKATFGCT